MGKTTYYRIPYPDATTVGGEAWNVTVAKGLQTVDTLLHDQQSLLYNTIGISGKLEEDILPYRLIGTGRTWPAADTVFGPFTLSKMVDDWFYSLYQLMNGRLSFPVRLPEAAYCGTTPALRGSTVNAVMGPVVRLVNDSNRNALPQVPCYLSNTGGIVPAEPFSLNYPIIFPRSGIAKTLAALNPAYATNLFNVDSAVPDEDSTQVFSRSETSSYTMGTYRPAYFDFDNFTENDTITITGNGIGTFRIYGLSSGNVSYIDVSKTEYATAVTTSTTTFTTILGVAFKGTEFTEDLASCDLDYGNLDVVLTSGIASLPFVTLKAYRPCASIDSDTMLKPERRFIASWECYDPGFLLGSSSKVAGIPFLMFSLGARDNRISFLKENLRDQGLTDAQIDADVKELMTQDLLDVPSVPKPLYIVGSDKNGATKTWTITPKLMFTTVNNLGYDGVSYHNNLDTYPENAFTQDFSWPADGVVFDPQPPSGIDSNSGTFLLYRYEFPTDLGEITQLLWANADSVNQYGKVVGLAVPIPIGRVLANTAPGNPTPVKLWTQNILDNAAKFDALVDILVGYLSGNTAVAALSAQVEAIGAQLGFSQKDTHMLINALPIAVPALRFFPLDNVYNKRDIDIQFTVNSYVGSEFGDANLRCEIQNFINNSVTPVSEFRIYFATRKDTASEYNKDGDSGSVFDHWSHYYDETFNRSYVIFPFSGGVPSYNELHFKGAGNVFAGVLVFSDGSKFVSFPANGALFPETDTRYLRNPTTIKYIKELNAVDDGTFHLICLGNLDADSHEYGDAFAVVTENPQDYKIFVENTTTGESGEWATGASNPTVDFYNKYNRKDDTPREDLVSYDSFVKHTNKIYDGTATAFVVKVNRRKEDAIIAQLSYAADSSILTTKPTSISMYESYFFSFGGLGSLSSIWMLVSVFYFMWLISPAATSLIFVTSTLGAPQSIRDTVLGYLKLSTNRFDSLLEWLRRWLIGEPKEITP